MQSRYKKMAVFVLSTNLKYLVFLYFQSSCLHFISQNPDIMDSELFEELPQNLQAEIYDLVIWAYPPR